MSKPAVFIVPGWSESGWQIRRFSKAFGDELEMSSSAQAADIIFAHSSGCYSLPKNISPKLIILVGPPFWPDRRLARRMLDNVVLDVPRQIRGWGMVFWANLRLHNFIRAALMPLRGTAVWRPLEEVLLESQMADKILLVRNLDDVYCGRQVKQVLKDYNQVKYIELPGLHEDCWFNPEPYIDLLLKEL